MSLTNMADTQRFLGQRCDRCGAAALYKADLPGGGLDLRFCGHHYNEHEAKLHAIGATIVPLKNGAAAPSHPLW